MAAQLSALNVFTGEYSGFMCLICTCGAEHEKLTAVRFDGRQTLIRYSDLHGNTALSDYLASNPPVINVHKSCQRRFTNDKYVPKKQPQHEIVGKFLRSQIVPIHWKEECFLCCCKVTDRFRQVMTMEILNTMSEACEKRKDAWGFEVLGRLQTCGDLVAAEARYHINCHTYFTSGKPKPNFSKGNINEGGRPVDRRMKNIFEHLCDWMENADNELYTVAELHAKMIELAVDDRDSVYTPKYLKILMLKRYGEHIYFASICGRKDVICFRNMAARVVNDKWYAERDKDVEKESQRIITAAAKLIKASIREMECNMDEYPSNSNISDRSVAEEWVPPLLRLFLKNIICDELKQVALGHSIVQASRPRSVIAPVLFGVGVSLDHVLASKWLLTTLSRLGFSISHDEVTRYKQSVVQIPDIDLPLEYPQSFTQWSADNVDHNVATLNGLGVFHGMGIISMSVNCNSVGTFGPGVEAVVKRLARAKVVKLTSGHGIPLLSYTQPNEPPLSLIKYKPINDLRTAQVVLDEFKLDLLWQMGWLFRNKANPRPNWSGYMQTVHIGDHAPPADFHMMPLIDMNPSDRSCILSALKFIISQAERLKIEAVCVTFDQPLWLKAVEIIHSEKLNIVCRLGGFHMIMSYLGSIGMVMSDTGLSEVLESCYGPNTVVHMMSGKAVSRAMRGHFLVDSALCIMLLQPVLDSISTATDASNAHGLNNEDVDKMRSMYDHLSDAESILSHAETPECMKKFEKLLSEYKALLAEKSRTAKLWLQYMDHIQILKDFIRAERTGNWNLHLNTVSKMLNLFAATGHNHYAKCSRLYLQMMQELPTTHPWLYDKFVNHGYHTVRRSDRYWAALSTDLIIEQVMMKAIKGRGGLTHGRGMHESIRLLWVKSMHKCASVRNAMSHLTDMENTANDNQHVDLGKSRVDKDYEDLTEILRWFEAHDPFKTSDSRLRSLSSGLVASDDDKVNCDMADEVGQAIMVKMDEMTFADVVLRKADQIKTLSSLHKKSTVTRKHVIANNSFLFNRLLVIMARTTPTNLEDYFKHELTIVPTALFKDNGLRKTNKAVLTTELRRSLSNTPLQSELPRTYVIDGGCLLHRVVWSHTGTYLDIAEQYLHFVKKHYGKICTVIFDGYTNGPSVKDHEHNRRAKNCSADIDVTETSPVFRNQSAFLLNANNKQAFVLLLSHLLVLNGYKVQHAKDDADTLIVRCALQFASQQVAVTVVADDTDILVLLVHHFKSEFSDIFMLSEITRSRSARAAITSVRCVRDTIGGKAAQQLLVVHALSGCDTTSSLFGHGKRKVFRSLVLTKDNEPQTDILGSANASRQEVVEAGLKLMRSLYGGRNDDTLNDLRYLSYMHQLATSKTPPNPERLPPTENAAQYHILRVHLQVIQWKYLMDVQLNPEDWGWKKENNAYVPIPTDLKAAPDDILNVITCKCKMLSKIPCSTQLCSCRKNGLRCVPACKHCCGKVCDNAELLTEENDIEADEDEEDNCQIVIDDLETMAGLHIYEEVVETDMDLN